MAEVDDWVTPGQQHTAPAQGADDWITPGAPPSKPMGEVLSEAAEHFGPGLLNYGAQAAHTIMHPVETAQNLWKLTSGGLQNLQSRQAEALGKPLPEAENEKYGAAAAAHLAEKYGGIENLKRSFAEDPVSVLADLSLPIQGGGGLLARAPGIVGRAGEIVSGTGRMLDPVQLAAKGVQLTGAPLKKFAAVQSGVGEPVLEEAYGAGLAGGAPQQKFREHFTGQAEVGDVVNQAREGLAAMKEERRAAYNREMDKLRMSENHFDERDRILDFGDIDKAIDKAEEIQTFRGRHGTGPAQVLDEGANDIRSTMINHINRWRELPPADYHTAEGLDALKRQLWNDMKGAQPGTPARAAAQRIYNAVKGTIEGYYPKYTEIMRDYQEASRELDEVTRALSLGDKASIDTSVRKLQSLLRNNVTSSFAHRAQLGERLSEAGAPNLRASLAGQALNTSEPRGLAKHAMQNVIPAIAGMLGYGTHGGLGAAGAMAATLPFMFPRVVGEGAFRAGQARRLIGPTIERARNLPLVTRDIGEAAQPPFRRGGSVADLIGPTIRKQEGGELSPDDQAAMMPETFVPPAARSYLEFSAPKDYGYIRDFAQGMATLPQRAIEASEAYRRGEGYDPAPMMEAASLPMGTGAIAGVPVRAGETALAAGYPAYKGMLPYDVNTLPVRNARGDIIRGGDLTPREITSFEREGAKHAGFYSDDPAVASRFAEALTTPYEGGSVFPVNLELSNPLVIDAAGKPAAAFQFDAVAREHKTVADMKRFNAAFDDPKYDGVILKNTKDEGTVYVPKTGSQVTSKFGVPRELEEQYGPIGTHPKEQALTVNDILHPDTPALPARSRNVEDIAQDLHMRGAAALRDLGVKEGRILGSSPRSDELISRALASEVKNAIGRGGNTAQDWYTKAIDEAMEHAATIHPELKGDPTQKMGFTSALAVTSQGETVASNVRLAEQAYDHFKRTGRFPTDIKALKGPSINENFEKLNDLLDRLGPEGTRDFLHSEFTVRDLKAMGYPVGKENMDTKVYGSSILGPKIGGGFYQNLNGNYDPVTMDLWFMRGWGRLTGTLVGKPEVMPQATERLTDAMREAGMKVPRDPKKLAQIADDIVAKHEKDYRVNRAAYDSGDKAKSELTLASERYQANSRGINETPTSGSQRQWMRARVNRAREILAGQGHNLTNADLQAIWWYPEKELYSKLGGRDSEAINTDYATVYRNLAARRAAGQP